MSKISQLENKRKEHYSVVNKERNDLKHLFLMRNQIKNSNHNWALQDYWIELIPNFSFIAGNTGLNSTERKVLSHLNKAYEELSRLNNWKLKKESSLFFENINQLISEYMFNCGYDLKVVNDKYKFKRIK